MRRYITREGQILTDEECEWIDWFRTLTLAQRAEVLELLREWTKDKEPAGEEKRGRTDTIDPAGNGRSVRPLSGSRRIVSEPPQQE